MSQVQGLSKAFDKGRVRVWVIISVPKSTVYRNKWRYPKNAQDSNYCGLFKGEDISVDVEELA